MLGWLKKQPTPDPRVEVLDTAISTNTPDLITLSKKKMQLLFVYGTEKQGHPHHQLVKEHSLYMAMGFSDDNFTLWKKNLGNESFPIALEGSGWKRPDWNTPPRARVQGELYAIETSQLIKLDNYFDNTLVFHRKRIPILVPYRRIYEIPCSDMQNKINQSMGIQKNNQVVTTDTKVTAVNAWMYIGKPKFWTDQLSHFFGPVQLYPPRLGYLGNYYNFSHNEYQADFKPKDINSDNSFDWSKYSPPEKPKVDIEFYQPEEKAS